MTFVVIGPKATKFTKLVANITIIGTPASSKLFSLSMPQNPASLLTTALPALAILSPGHVSASRTGRAVWKVK